MGKTLARRAAVRRSNRTAISRKPVRTRQAPSKAIKSYRAAVAFLNSQTNYETMARVGYNQNNFNLSRMLRILNGIGNPHKKFKSVHIAGTKGKGSTCHMLASMLTNANYRTGLYVSPHIVELRERITIDGAMVSEAEFARLIARIAPVVRKLQDERPTFFEIITAAAFLYFANEAVDIAVIETGLGGRLDSTNVIKPEVCGITSISFDHTAQLGNRLEQIAAEKAGIIKAGVPVILAPQPSHVKRVFAEAANRAGAPLRVLGDDIEFSFRFESSRLSGPQTRVCMSTPASRFDHVRVPLLGEHQAYNCGVALAIVDALRQRGFEISEQHAVEGLQQVKIAGRLEMLREQPRTIVDGAHNAASISALMRAIGQNISYDSMVVIFACAADKDIDGMLGQIQLGADKVIFTNNGTARSALPQELLQRFMEKSQKMAQVAANLQDAYRIASHCVTRDDLICITGSFYLVGEAKRLHAQGLLS